MSEPRGIAGPGVRLAGGPESVLRGQPHRRREEGGDLPPSSSLIRFPLCGELFSAMHHIDRRIQRPMGAFFNSLARTRHATMGHDPEFPPGDVFGKSYAGTVRAKEVVWLVHALGPRLSSNELVRLALLISEQQLCDVSR